MSNKTLEIQLLGKTYSIACPAGQEPQLRMVAEQLNQRLEGLRARTGTASLEQLTIMAALNLNHELLMAEQQQNASQQLLENRIQVLQDAIEHALSERTGNQVKGLDAESASS